MKKQLFTFFLVAGMAMGVYAQQSVQEKDLPAGIQTSFKKEFADANGAEWKMKDGSYKVHFKRNGVKNMASFDETGKLTSKGVQIKENELPAAISTAISSTHSGRKMDEIYRVEKDGKTSYLVKLTGDPETKLMYTEDGQLVKDKSNY
jgi:hypothetical protein